MSRCPLQPGDTRGPGGRLRDAGAPGDGVAVRRMLPAAR